MHPPSLLAEGRVQLRREVEVNVVVVVDLEVVGVPTHAALGYNSIDILNFGCEILGQLQH